ncbi:MAG TPA: LysR family transcriptional regulator [Pseudomonadales bacterium]
MDTELLRTFLEVRKTRHFARAAENLFVTQAAVSARIRQLESLVGQALFTRARNNIQLTPAGHQLVPYAESILASLDRALTEAAVGSQPLVVMGCLPSLREIYLDGWLVALLGAELDCRIRIESLNTAETVARLRDGSLDLAMIYEPPQAADLWVEELTRFDLRLVSTRSGLAVSDALEDYVHVDWGASLARAYDDRLQGIAGARVRLDSALLAQRILLMLGGTAYLASPAIASHLQAGQLYPVGGAPVVRRIVYLIGAGGNREERGISDLVRALHTQAAGSE